jgi:hypothetical protein
VIESRQPSILLTCSDTATFPSVWFYLAERGQRREEGPPLDWIKLGLDSYVDPNNLSLRPCLFKLNAMVSVNLKILFFREHRKPKRALRGFHAWRQILRHLDVSSRTIAPHCELVTWRTKRVEPELRCSEQSDKLMLCVPWEHQEFGDYEDLRTSPGSRRAN